MSTSQRVSNNTGSIDAMLTSIGTGDVTISTWFKFDNLSADGGIFYAGAYSFDNYYLACKYINSTGKIRLQARSGTTGPDDTIDNDTVIEVGKWYHIVAVRSGTTGKIYVNGALNSTTAANFGVSLGSGSAGVTTGFRDLAGANETGRNKELAIWDAALSDADVYLLYNYGLPNNLALADSYDTDRTANLKLWWRMGDNNNGALTTVADQTGNGYTGTIIGGAEFVVDHPDGHKNIQVSLQDTAANILARSQDRIGRTALATDTNVLYIFDGNAWRPFFSSFNNIMSASFGSSGAIRIPANSDLNFSGDMTVSCWVKFNVVNTYRSLLAVRSASAVQFNLMLSDLKKPRFYSGAISDGTTIFQAGQWYHVLVSCESGVSNGTKIYVNGALEGSSTHTITSLSNQFEISGLQAFGSYYVNGLMDEVAIWDSALTPSDVALVYNGGIPASISSLNPIGWWRMGDGESGVADGGAAGTITNIGSTANNLTVGGGSPTYTNSVV